MKIFLNIGSYFVDVEWLSKFMAPTLKPISRLDERAVKFAAPLQPLKSGLCTRETEMGSVPFSAPNSLLHGQDAVYVAALPLRATKGPAQILMSAAYSLSLWNFQHYLVIIRPSSPQSQALAFDFQPKDPENLFVALAAISRKPVPGVVLVRKLGKLPKRRCWFIGFSSKDCIDMAYKFNEHWQTDLKIGENDCRDYTNGLVGYLTGEQNVLERLRRHSDG